MIEPGDILELDREITVRRDGKVITLCPPRLTVGLYSLANGLIIGHVAGVRTVVVREFVHFYHVVGSIGKYPYNKIKKALDKRIEIWDRVLGDRIPSNDEVRTFVDSNNRVLKLLIPEALGIYCYRFTGVYADNMKRRPCCRLEWIPPAIGETSEDDPDKSPKE